MLLTMKRRPSDKGAPDRVVLKVGGVKSTVLKDWLGHAVTTGAAVAKKKRICLKEAMLKKPC
jgi:type II secretory pathway component PulL